MTALRVILAFSILSTASHYAHNFVAVEDYPGSGTAVQVAIVLSWPLLTAIGLYGYRLYSQGRFRDAESEFLAALEIEPANDYAHFGAGLCRLRAGDRAGARGHLRQALVMRPDNADYQAALADAADPETP